MRSGVLLTTWAATSVEILESALIVYAIGRGGHPQAATAGAVSAIVLVFALAPLGISVLALLPVAPLRWIASAALLGLGLWWIVKYRQDRGLKTPSAIAHHASAFAAAVAAFQISLMEGGEVLIVAGPIGIASHDWLGVGLGVGAGIATVVGLLFALRGQLDRLPEQRVKFVAGVMCALLGAWFLWQLVAPAIAARAA
jgi:uncharacterized membrane protein